MENNENNFHNEVNDVENNVKAAQEKTVAKEKKSGKGKTIVLMILVLLLVLAVGVLAGMMFSGSNKPEFVKQIEEKVINKEDEKVSKKIDESKDWVYDADYCKKNENKKAYGAYEGEEYNSVEDLKVPYININSDYAEKVNEEIKALYDKEYGAFGKQSGYQQYIPRIEYTWYNTDKILSVAIEHIYGWTNAGHGSEYVIYNINLETLEEATYEEVYKECGFSSSENVKKNAEIALLNLNDESQGVFEGTVIKYDKFFMNKEGINLLIPNGVGNPMPLSVKPDMIRNDTDRTDANNQNQTTSYFEQNKNLNYTSNPKDNINGKVAIIKMGEKTFQTTTYDGYYTYTDNFGNSYNIKEITNITSEYRMTSNDGATNLFRAVIEYIDNNNAKKSFDTAVFVPNDANNYITLSINGPYENYTGTTSFVRSFTDLYDDANEKLPNGTSKIIKQLSPSGWAGSSMQEVRLYDNGDVYHVVYNGDGNTEENVISFKLIARNADTIEEQMNGQAVEKIIVKGKNLTKISDDGQLWIVFENN